MEGGWWRGDVGGARGENGAQGREFAHEEFGRGRIRGKSGGNAGVVQEAAVSGGGR